MLEQRSRLVFTDVEPAPGRFTRRDVLDGDQHAFPARLIPWQDSRIQLYVEAFSLERVIDRVAGKPGLPGDRSDVGC